MENQHRKITGYRELDQVEIDLMNEVKALGIAMEGVLIKVDAHISMQVDVVDKMVSENKSNEQILAEAEIIIKRMENATPQRFLAMAKTELQTGLMYATRAVAQPEFF